MDKLWVVILGNEIGNDHKIWIKACQDYHDWINYEIVNLTSDDWLEQIQKKKFDILLAKPGGLTTPFKQLYDERIYILQTVLGYEIFPSLDEILIHENKRFLSFWLKANKIPHPATHVFYALDEALIYIENAKFPLVAKLNMGASGRGVKLLNNRNDVRKYTNQIFSKKGVYRQLAPNLKTGNLFNRLLFYLKSPAELLVKLKKIIKIKEDIQKGYLILQEYIPHTFEWRVVRIGDSFFAHKKLKVGEKASGALKKEYDNPPFRLLNFVKEVTDKQHFYSVAIDIFEREEEFLVNEIQCIFGQSDPYQMLVDGIPGRYISSENGWIFQEGNFNLNESFNLRLSYLLKKFNITNELQ